METLSCHSNTNTWAIAKKKKKKKKKKLFVLFVEANAMNISAKFHHCYPSYSFWEDDFLIFFSQIKPFAMATNQVQRFRQKWYVW